MCSVPPPRFLASIKLSSLLLAHLAWFSVLPTVVYSFVFLRKKSRFFPLRVLDSSHFYLFTGGMGFLSSCPSRWVLFLLLCGFTYLQQESLSFTSSLLLPQPHSLTPERRNGLPSVGYYLTPLVAETTKLVIIYSSILYIRYYLII